MEDRRVYEEVRALVEANGGSMQHEREGYQWGAWIIELNGKKFIARSNGSGYPDLDQLFVPKNNITNPSHWKDYTTTLKPNAWEKLVQLLLSEG